MPKYLFSLFVAGDDAEARELVASIEAALAATLPAEDYVVNVIDVLAMPEKALERDVFVTPTLVRDLPTPVLKLIGNVAQTQRLIALIVAGRDGGSAMF